MSDPSDTSLLRRQADEWDGGRGPRLRDLLSRSPSLRDRREELLDLVYQEIILREQTGETPLAEDYLTLLPDLKDDLQVLFALDQAVQPQPPPPAPADLPRYLVQLGLLSPAEARRYHSHIPIGDLLIDLGSRALLTPYQIERIRDGLATDLVLGGYIITDIIGRGGMGQVLRGVHRELGRTAALKVIRNDFVVGTAVVRFQREARAVARLNHPNVVTLFEAALLGQRPYLAMEYVGGRALSKVVEEDGPMPPREALEIVRQSALGLHHAHTQGLVHRDIKPGNIILADTPASPAARVKVLDFGLVALRDASDSLTETGTSLGTPDYMAPEQFSSARLADARADLYSLGCTFYYLLTGKPPFPGGTLWDKRDAHEKQQPENIAGLPSEVGDFLQRLLAKRPVDRFASAAVVAEEAERLTTTTRPQLATPVRLAAADPSATTAFLPSTRRPRRRWLIVAGVGLLLIGGFAALASRRGTNRPDKDSSSAPSREGGTADSSTSTAPVVPSPAAVIKLPAAPALEPAIDPDHHMLNRLLFTRTSASRAIFAPSGDIAVITGEDGIPRRWDLRSHELPNPAEREPTHPEWLGPFLPDGKSLLSGDDEGEVRRWSWPGLAPELLAPMEEPPKSRIWTLALKPGGEKLVTGQAGGWLRTWDLKKGKEIARERPCEGDLRAIAISPDGRRALCGGGDGDKPLLFEYEFQSKAIKHLKGHAGPVWGAIYSQDGRFAATAGADSALIIWRMADAREVAREKFPEGALGLSLFLRPDGKVLATGDGNGYLHLWQLPEPWDTAGARLRLLHSFKGDGSLTHITFDSSGTRLLSCNGREVILWEVPR